MDLQNYLERHNLTQAQLIKLLKLKGFRTTCGSMSNWCLNKTTPTEKYIRALADIFGISAAEMLKAFKPRKVGLLNHSFYRELEKRLQAKYNIGIVELVYQDCGVLITSHKGLHDIKKVIESHYCESLGGYIQDIIARKTMTYKLKRVKDGEYLFERNYSAPTATTARLLLTSK